LVPPGLGSLRRRFRPPHHHLLLHGFRLPRHACLRLWQEGLCLPLLRGSTESIVDCDEVESSRESRH
jgi:hypothetical protein